MPNNLAVLQKREEVRNDWEALEVSLVGLGFLSEREVVNIRDLSSVFPLAASTVKLLGFFSNSSLLSEDPCKECWSTQLNWGSLHCGQWLIKEDKTV